MVELKSVQVSAAGVLLLMMSAYSTAMTISGSPAVTAKVGAAYSFTPVLADSGSCNNCFRIRSLPSWASFSTQTGRLSGTPAAPGKWGNIRISASVMRRRASLPAFTITVLAATSAATLKITGTPATSAAIGSFYSFKPTVSATAGSTLGFAILRKPAWATFNSVTGTLSGTPVTANTGTFPNIVISVSDGQSRVGLPAFNLSVAAPAPKLGSVSLTWNAPTQNTDASVLTNLAGFRVYYGLSSVALTKLAAVPSPTATSASIENLGTGTWYFALADYNLAGAESTKTPTVSVTIP